MGNAIPLDCGIMCRMNDDKSLFAEMLGMKGRRGEQADISEAQTEPEADAVDELDVQRVVVQEMARDNAELKELHSTLEEEKQSLESAKASLEAQRQALADENARLKAEKAALESDRKALKARIAALEGEISEQKLDLDEARGLNAELEKKLVRMGRALFAVRRAAAEAAKVEIGGRRW